MTSFERNPTEMENDAFEGDLECREKPGTSKPSAAQIKKEKRRIYKNLILISFAFLLLFTAFGTTSSLQSSINEVDWMA